MRKKYLIEQKITLEDIDNLSQEQKQFVFLNSNSKEKKSFLAIGEKARLQADENKVFEKLEKFIDKHQDWVFGYISYDLKNEVEPQLNSNNEDRLGFPEFHFFVPQFVLELSSKKSILHVTKKEEKEEFLCFLNKKEQKHNKKGQKAAFSQKIKKSEYIDKFNKIKQHIQLGDIYEMNFCHEFFAENTAINPFATYTRLNQLTSAPFSSFYKNNSHFILSGSPERYLKKENNTITSQPIKGTAKRGKTKREDELLIQNLQANQKERSENIMIVDLVRNDLSRTAEKNSVKVDELCAIYSFETVHQMISTITCTIDKSIHPVKVLQTTFPMGSMTGAPKIEAMKIIEQLESTKRGVYSGAVGYFTPNQDFDFNVIIRTLLYNELSNSLSFMVGGAITDKSKAEEEYNETLLKAEAMINCLK